MAFDVVGDGGEMDLEFGLGKPKPSHAPELIAPFPGSEDFLDPGTDRTQRSIVRFEPFGGRPAMPLAHQLGGSARGEDGLFDRQSVIGTVGINLARRIENDRQSNRDIGLIGRRRLGLPDETAVLVGRDMGLIAMRGRPRAVPWPRRPPCRPWLPSR